MPAKGDKVSAYMAIEDHIIHGIDRAFPVSRRRIKNKMHLDFLKSLPCCRCGLEGQSLIYRLREGSSCGRSGRVGDNFAIPLCPECRHTGADCVFNACSESSWFESFLRCYPPHFANHLYAITGQEDTARAYFADGVKLYQLKHKNNP